MKKKYNYLFGPVPSRRFGRSLGIDLTPYKTCSLDCVFCQLGRTKEKTITRKEYVLKLLSDNGYYKEVILNEYNNCQW